MPTLPAIAPRAPAVARHALAVDGIPVASLTHAGGLDMLADIVENDLGPGAVPKKHVANISWTPAQVDVGIGMGTGLYGWMKATFDQGAVPKNGTITIADFNFKQRSVLTFLNALLTSITVPRLAGDSKDEATFALEFAAEQVRQAAGDGSDIRNPVGTPQQPWLCSNFRFELGALPCARVASIESFAWLCTPVADQIGGVREPTLHPAKITVPDLKLSISSADYDTWAQAAKHWFIDGNHLEGDEMSGLITLLAPDLQTPLATITLSNVGFKRFPMLLPDGGSGAVAAFTVELYVETMSLQMMQYEG